MIMRRYCRAASLALACLIAAGGTVSASEAPSVTESQPGNPSALTAPAPVRRELRVALVPLIDNTGGQLTKSAAQRLMDRMDRELYVPLNDTMHWVEYLNEDEAAAAIREAMAAGHGKPRPEMAAREAAKALDADLVLFLVMEHFHQFIFHSFSWAGETYIDSAAALTVYGYDARHDRPIKASASRFERTDYLPSYEAEELAMEALEEALRTARAKDAVFPLSESGGKQTTGKGDNSNGGRV